jgi:type IV pilus assembly protein PilE
MTNERKKGFTLIEMMIILVIVAILVSLAVPSFRDTIRKSRRSDGINAITDIHLAQERWRANSTTYATLVQLGKANPMPSPDGHYNIAVTSNTATAYSITATAQGDQANDSCGNFTLAFNAGTITKTTSSGVADQCWRK